MAVGFSAVMRPLSVPPPSLITALNVLHDAPGVVRAGLASDRLRVITAPEAHTAESLQSMIKQAGLAEATVERVEPTLEDVFIALAGHDVVI